MNRITKKKHFAMQIRIATRKIWDSEFLLAKAKAEREGFRLEYDRVGERQQQTEAKLEKERAKKPVDKKVIRKLKELVDSLSKDHGQLKKRMAALDRWIEGPLHDESGIDKSIKGTLEGQRSLLSLLKDYKSKL